MNWNLGFPPGSFDSVLFNNDPAPATTNAPGLVNNVVNVSSTILRLQYSAFSNSIGANFHTTEIPAGNTLTVMDSVSAETLFVGTGTAETLDTQVTTTIRGGGTLMVTNPFGIINIRQGNASTGPHRATLDLSALDTFNCVVARVQLAGDGTSGTIPQTGRPSGTLLLGRTNIIATTTATAGDGLRIGTTAGNLNSSTYGQNAILLLGQTNLILSDAGMSVAGTRSTGLMMFQPGLVNPTAVFRNLAGTGRQNTWFIGENNSNNTGNSSTGTLDFTGGSVDAQVTSLFVGRGQSYGTTSDAGPGTGIFVFNAGVVDVSSLEIAQRRNNYGGPSRGFITVGGSGQLVVSGTVRFGLDRTIVATNLACAGTLNITNGGLFWAKSGIIDGGFGTNIINVDNGHLKSSGQLGRLASATDRPFDQLNLTNATLTLALSSSINYTNPACSVTNLNIDTALTLNVEGGGFGVGQYPLIKYYSSAIGGAGYAAITAGSLPSRTEGYFSNNVANRSIDLVVTNISAARWNGSPNGNWDIALTPNWIDLATSTATTYFEDAPPGDTVVFNDSAIGTTTVTLVTNVSPALISITNSAKTYIYNGPGKISGTTSLTKAGPGLVIITNAGANDFTGPVSILDGTVRLGLAPNRLPAVNVTLADLPTAGLVLGDQDQTVSALNGGGTAGGNINIGAGNLTATGGGTYNGVISGTGMFRKTGSGTQTFSGANTYGGGTYIAGTVTLVNPSGSGLGTGPIQIASGTLNVGNGAAAGLTGSTHITNAGTLNFNATNDITIGGIHGGGGVSKDNTNTLIITDASTFTAALLVDNGAVRLAHGDALGSPSGTTTIDNIAGEHVELTGNITVPENFSLQMKSGSFPEQSHIVNVGGTNTLTGNITGVAGGSFWTFRSDAGKLNFNGTFVNSASSQRWVRLTGAADGEWMTDLPDGGLGVSRLTKDGTGTWSLSGYKSYSGNTRVDGGRLRLDASCFILSAAIMTVGDGNGGPLATLAGVGQVMSQVYVNTNGILSPGDPIGTLIVANTLTNLGTCLFDLNTDTLEHDRVDQLTVVEYGGTLQLNLIGGGTALTNGASFQLFNATAYTGAFAAIVPATPGPGLSWNTSQLTVNGTLGIQTGPLTTPTVITVTPAVGQLNLSWPSTHTGWRLEAQTNSFNAGLSTNWFPVAGSASTNQVSLPVNPAAGSVFYRLVYP